METNFSGKRWFSVESLPSFKLKVTPAPGAGQHLLSFPMGGPKSVRVFSIVGRPC